MQPTPWWLTLVSILLSGGVAAFTTVILNTSQAERVIRRSKIEELCNLLTELLVSLTELRDSLDDDRRNPLAVDMSRMHGAQTLVGIYVPHMQQRFFLAVRKFQKDFPVGGVTDDTTEEEIRAALDGAIASISEAYGVALAAAHPILDSWWARRRAAKSFGAESSR